MNIIEVLDHGFVRLDAALADDLSVINSARVSFGKRIDSVDQITEGDEKLIGYLMKSRHGTPFEHNQLRFHVKAPIFVFREWHRHRIASINEMSARYMKLPGDFYIPENVRTRVGKPGHYTYEPADPAVAKVFVSNLNGTCEQSYAAYEFWLEKGIAPEQARLFLHVNHYSEMYWSVNARSLMNFLNLRNAPTAQWEICQYAIALENLFAECMPITYAAFVEHGRVAP